MIAVDAALRKRAAAILGKLAVLSEAPAGKPAAFVSGGAADSKVPLGVRERKRIDQLVKASKEAPSKDRSLYDFYLWHFTHATSEGALRFAVRRAEVDYDVRVRGAESSLAERKRHRDPDDEAAEIRLVLELGEGVPAQIVAYEGDYSVNWVRSIRERHGRHPEDGTVRPVWSELTSAERRRVVAGLLAEPMSVRDAARYLGVGRSTVQRYSGIREAA